MVFDKLKARLGSKSEKSPVDFVMVVGDGREDKKVFKWANKLKQSGTVDSVATVSLGNCSTEAAATLT